MSGNKLYKGKYFICLYDKEETLLFSGNIYELAVYIYGNSTVVSRCKVHKRLYKCVNNHCKTRINGLTLELRLTRKK